MRVRPATTEDEPFLLEMLGHAASWRAASPASEVWAVASNRVYLEGWGRPGDLGVIAEDEGRPLGAAWCRLFTAEGHGYGFVSEDIPEASVAVLPAARGAGTGTALLEALAVAARAHGLGALSLSVENDNPARELYVRLGYEEVADDGSATTMLLTLAP